MNYEHHRSNVQDVILLVTARTLRDRPSWDSDLIRAKSEIQMYAQMGIRVVTLALGRQRFRITMQMQQMTSVKDPVILSSYGKLVKNDGKILSVMKGICPKLPIKPGNECMQTFYSFVTKLKSKSPGRTV